MQHPVIVIFIVNRIIARSYWKFQLSKCTTKLEIWIPDNLLGMHNWFGTCDGSTWWFPYVGISSGDFHVKGRRHVNLVRQGLLYLLNVSKHAVDDKRLTESRFFSRFKVVININPGFCRNFSVCSPRASFTFF